MAIELGALALAIRDQGGDQVLQKLRRIDGQARQTGGKRVQVPVSAPGADATAAKLRGVGDAAKNATTAMADMGLSIKGVATALGAAEFGRMVGAFLLDTARAYDDAEAAARKLNAASKLTGASLDDVQRIAKEGQTAFLLSAGASAELTANVVKLTSRAGELNKSGEFMARWLDLAAANGLSAAEAMQALQTTIIGQDEGLNRLGLSNPQQIYDAWGKAAGTTAAKLTDAQKAQAIINEIVVKGGRVQGEYANSLDTAAGKTALLAQRTEQLKVAIGTATLPTRLFVVEYLTQWAEKGARVVDIMGRLSERVGGFGTVLRNVLRMTPFAGLNAGIDLAGAVVGGKPKAPAVTWQTLGGDKPPPPVAKAAVDTKKAAEEAAKAERERRAQIAEQVGAVETMMRLRATDLGTLQAAVRLEGLLTAELARGTASLERRAEIQQQLQTLRQSGALIKPLDVRDMPRTLDPKAATKIEVPVELRPKATIPPDAFEDLRKDVDFQFAGLGMSIAGVLGSAIATGFAGGDVGQVVLQGLGSIFMQMGQSLLTYGAAMVGLLPALANPFTSGPAALAAGAILLALGGALGGIAAGRGSRGGGSAGVSVRGTGSIDGRQTITDPYFQRATLPVGARGVTNARAATMPAGPTVQVIGVNSAEGQRLIGTSAAKFKTRGG